MTNGSRRSVGKSGFAGMPTTRPGWWSIRLAAAFIVLFMIWFAYVSATPIPRPTFFSDPLHAVLILSAAASAIAGMVAGLVAFVAARERSIITLTSVVLGGVVLFWTIAELMGD